MSLRALAVVILDIIIKKGQMQNKCVWIMMVKDYEKNIKVEIWAGG